MSFGNIPSNLVAPFLPNGQRPVGQEDPRNRQSTFKPVEQAAKTAHAQVQLRYREEDKPQRERERPVDDSEPEGEPLYAPDKAASRTLSGKAKGNLLDERA